MRSRYEALVRRVHAYVRRTARSRSDNGNISVLSLGFSVLTVMTVLVVSAATAVHIQQMRLTHLADELALEAADALDLGRYYAAQIPEPTENAAVPLAQQRMNSAVASHLAQSQGRINLPDVRVVSVETLDGNTASVTVAVTVEPLFGMEALMPFADGIVLVATGTARTY